MVASAPSATSALAATSALRAATSASAAPVFIALPISPDSAFRVDSAASRSRCAAARCSVSATMRSTESTVSSDPWRARTCAFTVSAWSLSVRSSRDTPAADGRVETASATAEKRALDARPRRARPDHARAEAASMASVTTRIG